MYSTQLYNDSKNQADFDVLWWPSAMQNICFIVEQFKIPMLRCIWTATYIYININLAVSLGINGN